MLLLQYTSRAAQLYKATLEKDVLKLATAPVSPTAAEAAKQGIDFLDSQVSRAVLQMTSSHT